jgi:hypothetical protein
VLPALPSSVEPVETEETQFPRPGPLEPREPAGQTGPGSGTITLRAQRAFCYPTVDEQPVAGFTVTYTLTPGEHRIFCARTKDGPRELAGTFTLRPGTNPEVVVKERGRPSLR